MNKEITCTVNKAIAVLSMGESGYTKEINLVVWNNGRPKYDIRNWFPNHDKYGKGIALTVEEARTLYVALSKEFGYVSQ